jgi:ubiquinone/menaquinone biosynthesis C-methylase UbiE
MQAYNRLHSQHYALKTHLGSNIIAPLTDPHDILDVGCGEGLWALDVAKSLPTSRVVGLDRGSLRAFPYHDPSNFLMVIGDFLEGPLPFAEMSFDYVHQRFLSPLVPTSRWPRLIADLARVARPGGWIEVVEYGSAYANAGPNTQQMLDWWKKTTTKQGGDLTLRQHLVPMLQRAGIPHVEQRTISVPLGTWGSVSGCAMSMSLEMYLSSFKLKIMTALQVSAHEFDRVLHALTEEWETYNTTYQFYAVYGQRPYAHLMANTAAITKRCVVAESI